MMLVLLFAHVLLATVGYVGLIATDAATLLMSGSTNPDTLRAGVHAWRNGSRIFGPFLGLGVLIGFGLAYAMHVSLASGWLIATYVLIVLALGVQAAVVIPWEQRAKRALDAGSVPTFAAVRFVLIWLAIAYTAIVAMMTLKPF